VKLSQLLTAPNQLTLLRMAFLPFIVINLVGGHYSWALVLFVLAGLSDALDGLLRTTYYSTADAKQTCERGYAELTDASDEEYRTNIQTAELNALNASLAVIRYKQLRGFYHDTVNTTHLLLGVSDLSVAREEG